MNEAVCIDCGAATAPCTGRRGCRHVGRWELYMVHDSIWITAGMPFVMVYARDGETGYLCVGCLEGRLGRQLHPQDFTDAPINEPSPRDTPRLAVRKLA
jgi:hypothetical protein